MKAIDSNLLVYASLANHPAMTACEQYVAGQPVWLTSVVNLVEPRRVLVGVYGVSDRDADIKRSARWPAHAPRPLPAPLDHARRKHRRG